MIKELGLENAKSVTTPSCREDVDKMLADMGAEVAPKEATQYRALAARLNYLALDRADIQFATKEVAKYMATPKQGNWFLLKRLARYLIGAPCLIHTFVWQGNELSLPIRPCEILRLRRRLL